MGDKRKKVEEEGKRMEEPEEIWVGTGRLTRGSRARVTEEEVEVEVVLTVSSRPALTPVQEQVRKYLVLVWLDALNDANDKLLILNPVTSPINCSLIVLSWLWQEY